MQEGQRSPAMTVTDGGPGQLASPQCPIVTRDPVAGHRLQVPGPGDPNLSLTHLGGGLPLAGAVNELESVEDMTALHAPTINADNRSPSDRAFANDGPAGLTPPIWSSTLNIIVSAARPEEKAKLWAS